MNLFEKFGLYSTDINLNSGPVHGIQNENFLVLLPFHDYSFCGNRIYCNLNSISEYVRMTEMFLKIRKCNLFK